MSFLKIADPKKRDEIVKNYMLTKKRIKESDLSEREEENYTKNSISNFFKPVVDSQVQIKDEITKEMQPILKAIEYPLAIEEAEKIITLGNLPTHYLRKFTSKKHEVDTTYGLYNKNGEFYIGNQPVQIDNNNLIIGDKEYQGTNGLWELIVMKNPDIDIYTDHDLNTYADILLLSNSIRRNNDSNSDYPKSSRSTKWKNIIKQIWDDRDKRDQNIVEGSSLTFLPSDPNALLEKYNLLIASHKAGNTGVRNEIVSICDELKRQNIIDKIGYKNFISHLE